VQQQNVQTAIKLRFSRAAIVGAYAAVYDRMPRIITLWKVESSGTLCAFAGANSMTALQPSLKAVSDYHDSSPR